MGSREDPGAAGCGAGGEGGSTAPRDRRLSPRTRRQEGDAGRGAGRGWRGGAETRPKLGFQPEWEVPGG